MKGEALPPIRSRRRPRLKVVAHGSESTRHELAFTHTLNESRWPYIIEVWTFAEWEALAPAERPETYSILPGIGWHALREATRGEVDDVWDVASQALARYREYGIPL